MEYYPATTNAPNSVSIISQATTNLDKCLQMQSFDTSPENRFAKASELRQAGKFAEAGYEYNKAALSPEYQQESYIQLADIFKLMGKIADEISMFESKYQEKPTIIIVSYKIQSLLKKLSYLTFWYYYLPNYHLPILSLFKALHL